MVCMARKKKTDLAPLDFGGETLGQRLARLRKQKEYTQVQLAEKMGLIQVLISDYERDKLRPHPEVIVRFALALEITTDELLGLSGQETTTTEAPKLKIVRRMKKIEDLPPAQQKTLLNTIDTFLKGAGQ